MDINITRENFIELLNFNIKTQNTKISIPILSNVCIEAKDSKLILKSTNLENSIISVSGVEIIKEGTTTVNLKNIYDFVSNLKSEIINIKLDNNILTISDENNHISLNTISSEEFPDIPDSKGNLILKIPAFDFSTALDKVTFATSTDISKLILSGVLFEFDDKNLKLVGINGFRFSSVEIDNIIKETKETLPNIIVPSYSLDSVSKIIKELDMDNDSYVYVYIFGKNNQIIFEIENVTFVVRLIEGKYPDYLKIFPTDYESEFTLLTQDLKDVVKLSSIFRFKDISRIYLDIDPKEGIIKFQSSLKEVGESNSIIKTKIKGNKVIASFNSKYIMDFLNHIDSEYINIYINPSSLKKVSKFQEKDNSKFTYLVMPLMER
jgi:DNA polymerase-3 subunit beta